MWDICVDDVAGFTRDFANVERRNQSRRRADCQAIRYHPALSGDTPLLLTASAKSHNYRYYTINDDASSTTGLEYNDSGLLTKATQDKSTNRATRMQQ